MRVVDRLAQREASWRELDQLLVQLKVPGPYRPKPAPAVTWVEDEVGPNSNPYAGGRTKPAAPERPMPQTRSEALLRMAELYRSACADLMLAEAHDMPRETVAYLHDLVARGHNALYRSRRFKFSAWAGELLRTVPRQLRQDPALRLAALLFWGPMLIAGLLAAGRPEFASSLLGAGQIETMEKMYSESIQSNTKRNDAAMAGFYVFNNAGIGLRCFAGGLLFGLGSIFLLAYNGLTIGAVFGHMLTTPYAKNFYQFVTAHSAFELTAIVFAGAAGLRLGWGLIDHQGQTRIASLHREAVRSLPVLGASVFLFILAAFLEGFVSASSLPYPVKAGIAITSAMVLILYLALGGRSAPPAGQGG